MANATANITDVEKFKDLAQACCSKTVGCAEASASEVGALYKRIYEAKSRNEEKCACIASDMDKTQKSIERTDSSLSELSARRSSIDPYITETHRDQDGNDHTETKPNPEYAALEAQISALRERRDELARLLENLKAELYEAEEIGRRLESALTELEPIEQSLRDCAADVADYAERADRLLGNILEILSGYLSVTVSCASGFGSGGSLGSGSSGGTSSGGGAYSPAAAAAAGASHTNAGTSSVFAAGIVSGAAAAGGVASAGGGSGSGTHGGAGSGTASPGTQRTPRNLFKTEQGWTSTPDGMMYNTPFETGRKLISNQGGVLHYTQDCGVVSCANIARMAGVDISEREALDRAINGNCCSKYRKTLFGGRGIDGGGTLPEDRQRLLRQFGIDSHLETQSVKNISDRISEGRGVIISVRADKLWQDPRQKGLHAITVTSVLKNPDGSVHGFYVCDSGTGGVDYSRFYTAREIAAALTPNRYMNVTTGIIR